LPLVGEFDFVEPSAAVKNAAASLVFAGSSEIHQLEWPRNVKLSGTSQNWVIEETLRGQALVNTGFCCVCRDGVKTRSTVHRLRIRKQIACVFRLGNKP
jgi:hypothetical protein